MTGLADVDGFKLFIQVLVWLGFQLLNAEVMFSRQLGSLFGVEDHFPQADHYIDTRYIFDERSN